MQQMIRHFFTGIPPHVLLMSEMEALKLKLEVNRNKIESGLRDELDRRHVGGERFQMNEMLNEVSRVHDRMIDVLQNQLLRGGRVGGGGGDNINENRKFLMVMGDKEEEEEDFDAFGFHENYRDSRFVMLVEENEQ